MVRRARSLSSLVASVAGVASLLLLLVVAPSARAAHLEFGVRAGWNSTDIAIEARYGHEENAEGRLGTQHMACMRLVVREIVSFL